MRSVRFRVLLLVLVDALGLVASCVFALWIYQAIGFGHYKFGFGFYLGLWPAIAAYLTVNALFRLYHGNAFHPAVPVHPVEELRRLVGASVIVHLGVIAALAIAYQSTEHYSRAVILLSCAFTALLAQPLRDLVRCVLKRLGWAQIPVKVIGEGELAGRLTRSFAEDDYIGFRVSDEANLAVVIGDLATFRGKMAALAGVHTHIVFVPSDAVVPIYGARTVMFNGIGGIETVNQRKMRMLRVEKWLLDKALSLLSFVLLSPFFILVPLLVKLTSKGPVFYRQTRLGRNGRRIRVWKFRSMYADADERLKAILAGDPAKRAEWEASFKLKDDPRVTPLGRFLRKTSIDEFPQLFNVFAGDMTLVGPRPIVEKEVAYYGDAYETFSSVKPGITGLWQVSGRSDTDYPQRVALDLQYILNWSPWLDIWILFRTVGAVFLMRGAR